MDVRFYGALGEDLGELVFEEGFGEIGIGTEMDGEFAVFSPFRELRTTIGSLALEWCLRHS